MAQSLHDAVKSFATKTQSGIDKEDVCYEMLYQKRHRKSSDFSVFPALVLLFRNGRRLELPAMNYMYLHETMTNVYCLGIFAQAHNSGAVIGSIALRNMFIDVDAARGRVHLARASCSSLSQSSAK